MLDDHAEDLEHSSDWLIFACQDIEQCIALFVGGAALQDGLHVPVTVMDSAGEIEGGDDMFVHKSDVDGFINEGDKVEFEVGEGQKGPAAQKVKKLE